MKESYKVMVLTPINVLTSSIEAESRSEAERKGRNVLIAKHPEIDFSRCPTLSVRKEKEII